MNQPPLPSAEEGPEVALPEEWAHQFACWAAQRLGRVYPGLKEALPPAAAASVALGSASGLAADRIAFGLAAASVALGLAENEGSNPFGLAAGRTEYRVAFGMAEASVALGMAALRPDYSVYSFPYLIILLTRHV